MWWWNKLPVGWKTTFLQELINIYQVKCASIGHGKVAKRQFRCKSCFPGAAPSADRDVWPLEADCHRVEKMPKSCSRIKSLNGSGGPAWILHWRRPRPRFDRRYVKTLIKFCGVDWLMFYSLQCRTPFPEADPGSRLKQTECLEVMAWSSSLEQASISHKIGKQNQQWAYLKIRK